MGNHHKPNMLQLEPFLSTPIAPVALSRSLCHAPLRDPDSIASTSESDGGASLALRTIHAGSVSCAILCVRSFSATLVVCAAVFPSAIRIVNNLPHNLVELCARVIIWRRTRLQIEASYSLLDLRATLHPRSLTREMCIEECASTHVFFQN